MKTPRTKTTELDATEMVAARIEAIVRALEEIDRSDPLPPRAKVLAGIHAAATFAACGVAAAGDLEDRHDGMIPAIGQAGLNTMISRVAAIRAAG
jgi:hypothetical protein